MLIYNNNSNSKNKIIIIIIIKQRQRKKSLSFGLTRINLRLQLLLLLLLFFTSTTFSADVSIVVNVHWSWFVVHCTSIESFFSSLFFYFFLQWQSASEACLKYHLRVKNSPQINWSYWNINHLLLSFSFSFFSLGNLK